jgi:cytochrome c oxidase accessory protein FixG
MAAMHMDRNIHAVAEAPSPEDDHGSEEPLYAARRKIYPQSVQGQFRRIKWALLIGTLGVYYLLPFARWDRGPNAPDQAVLIDFPSRRFYFFFIEIWPQEVYYLTGLLVLAAMTLFLMNALAGRVWCGYLCPQTVWTDLFTTVERWTEGDQREHYKRDAGPWTFERVGRKALKHGIWLVIAWWTGGAWVLYFADAPSLVKQLANGNAPFAAYAAIGILTITTYALAGHLREQVCVYMCPWPRIQAALTDEYALNVTYRYDRGEPRASIKKAALLRQAAQPAGDCIDCRQCVNVCPTGVDIRQGLQLDCIQCGLCIDACDTVMRKIGRPERLIAYDTDVNIHRRQAGQAEIFKPIRMRTLLYFGVIAVAGGIMLYTLATRSSIGLNVIHERNPVAVKLSDGSIRNAYIARIINKELEARQFHLTIAGLTGSIMDIADEPVRNDGRLIVEVGPDQTREVRLFVTDYYGVGRSEATSVTFYVTDMKSGERAATSDYFRTP